MPSRTSLTARGGWGWWGGRSGCSAEMAACTAWGPMLGRQEGGGGAGRCRLQRRCHVCFRAATASSRPDCNPSTQSAPPRSSALRNPSHRPAARTRAREAPRRLAARLQGPPHGAAGRQEPCRNGRQGAGQRAAEGDSSTEVAGAAAGKLPGKVGGRRQAGDAQIQGGWAGGARDGDAALLQGAGVGGRRGATAVGGSHSRWREARPQGRRADESPGRREPRGQAKKPGARSMRRATGTAQRQGSRKTCITRTVDSEEVAEAAQRPSARPELSTHELSTHLG